jgi:outer membrane lipoprotein SlyB
MRTTILTVSSVIAVSCCMLTSCDTPVGQGAAWGAATGAIIGGAATGNVRAASIGAAAGAAAGALTGKIIRRIKPRSTGRRRRAVTLMPGGREDQGFFIALTQAASTIYVACRPVDSLATLIRVAFSASHSRDAALRRIECF